MNKDDEWFLVLVATACGWMVLKAVTAAGDIITAAAVKNNRLPVVMLIALL